VPAVSRKIVETELIEEYHWLPQDIAKIPYKRLQEHFLIKRQKNANAAQKMQVQKFKANAQSVGSGQRRTFVREV